MERLNWTIIGPSALQISDWKDIQHLMKCSTVIPVLQALALKSQEDMEGFPGQGAGYSNQLAPALT